MSTLRQKWALDATLDSGTVLFEPWISLDDPAASLLSEVASCCAWLLVSCP
jgi:hypothetical protein